jgi:hypothetical protein
MDVLDSIVSADTLVAAFGHWPSFHDAEVVWIRLDRRPCGAGDGPTLEALVHVFETTGEVGSDGCYVRRHHVLVHLRFRDVAGLRLEGFNQQNALFGLAISHLGERQGEHVQFDARFDPAYGVDGSFQCQAVEVVTVTPCSENGEPIPA